MRTAVWMLLLVVVCSSSAAIAGDRPQMTCHGVGERWFVCNAFNVPRGTEPSWRVYSSPLSYGGSGRELSFPTPAKWSVVEMTFDYGEQHFLFSIEVRRYRGHVWFQKPKSTTTRNAE